MHWKDKKCIQTFWSGTLEVADYFF
jgi:hypothetical protein